MRRILLVLFSFLAFEMQAQEFSEGSIISLVGDTTKGLIQNQPLIILNRECVFKENETSKIIKYTSNMIKGFIMEDRIFESFRYEKEGFYISEFGLVLTKGEINLYQAKEDFLVSKNNELILLKNPLLVNGKDIMYYSYRHRFQLDSLMLDWMNRFTLLNKSLYKPQSLKELVRAYNVSKSNNTYTLKQAKNKLVIGAKLLMGAGVIADIYDPSVTFNTNLIGVGIYSEFFQNKNINKRFSGTFEADFFSQTVRDLKIKPFVLNLNFLFKYALSNPTNKSYPYAGTGLSVNKNIGGTYVSSSFGVVNFPVMLGYHSALNNKKRTKFDIDFRYSPLGNLAYKSKLFMLGAGVYF
jgi:hypothetical protein